MNLLHRTSQGTEAADVLRFSTRTLREYVSRGEIEGRIIGGRKIAAAPHDYKVYFGRSLNDRLGSR